MKVPSYTFAGGVLAPGLWGRVDLAKYQTGVKVATNFVVGVEGGLYKRWGQYFVGKPKFQDKDAKLIPWKIADDDSYILEIGDLYIRLIRFGGHVLYPGAHVPHADSDAIDVDGFLEITTPYTAAQARELKFTFANDVAYIFHKNHQPRQLRRLGLYDWDFTTTTFNPHVSAPAGLAAVGQIYDADAGNWVNDPSAPNQSDIGGGTIYEPAPTDKVYKISATMTDGLETEVSSAVTEDYDLGYHQYRIKLTWAAKAGADFYNIYKGDNGIFGYIGQVEAGTLVFYDTNLAPSFDRVPVKPFSGFGTDQWPRVGEFYKQRMGYAATEDEPQTLWFSRPLYFNSMSTSIPLQDNDAIKIPLVGKNRHTINHMLELKKFIIFTDSAEWVMKTTGGDALTAGTVDPAPETYYGSDPNLVPIPIGDRILFVENITSIIRDMGYEFTTNAYTADDLSRLARHFFRNQQIISWDYTSHPQSVLHCVVDGGNCPTLTYVREHEIWGWSEYQTEGNYLDIATVSEITQDATYFQVERKINGTWTRVIERVEVSSTDLIEDMFYVDCGLTYADPREFSDMDLVLTPGNQSITITDEAHGLSVGDEIQIETTELTLRVEITSVTTDTITSDAILYGGAWPSFGTDFEILTGNYLIATDSVSGFDHLAEQTDLIGLADGNVIEDITVNTDGTIDLPYTAVRFHCGFPYQGEIITLDLDDERAAGRYIERTVDSITLRLEKSRGVFAGPSLAPEHIQQIPSRSDENYDEPNRPLDGVYEIPAAVAWDKTCGVIVRSPYPLPCNVLNIVPDIQYGS